MFHVSSPETRKIIGMVVSGDMPETLRNARESNQLVR
jgi:hypothetical protein